jgi:P2-related tail formation protein
MAAKYCDVKPKSRNSEVRIVFIARQRFGKHIATATNTQAMIK